MSRERIALAVIFSWVTLLAILWGMGLWFPVSAQGGPQVSKFDATLRTAMQNPAGVRAAARMLGMKERATPRSPVSVFVKVSDNGSELGSWLTSHGGRVLAQTSNILNVSLPWDELAAMGEVASVQWVEASLPLRPMMDVATGSTGANVQAVQAASPRFTGKGVLIGVIDTGIDATNPAFRDSQGRSRIRYLWDQSDPATPGPTVTLPGGGTTTYPGGREYTNADFDANPSLGAQLDVDGHGTHVAGIAGGRDARYPGVAPEAQFLIVRSREDFADNTTTTSALNLAYEYLVARARELDLPLVVNVSMGVDIGPHDGSTLFENSIEARIDSPLYNLRTCIAAGNSQDADLHVQDQIPANGSSIAAVAMFQYSGGVPTWLAEIVDIWYPVGARPNIRLVQRTAATPGVELGTVTVNFGQVTPGPLDFLDAGNNPTGTKASVVQELPNPQNGTNHVQLTFIQPNAGDRSYFVIEMQNPSTHASRVDYYIQRGINQFLTATRVAGVTQGPTPGGTLDMPSTTPGGITVASYATKSTWTDADGQVHDDPTTLGALSHFSSLGPVRDTTLYTGTNVSKPDIAAPGQRIASQRSAGANYNATGILDSTHVVMQGTSMATPMVTGVIALMLQENPTLTAAQVKAKLFEYARKDAFTTAAVPNIGFGYGKVDAEVCNHIVSAPPVLQEAQPDPDRARWNLRGYNFAASAQVLVNGLLLPNGAVTWNHHKSIDIQMDSNLATVYTITVRNQYAPDGQMDSTLTLAQQSFYERTGSAAAGTGARGGCFIATAAYGSYLDPHVVALRSFRDRWLLTNRPGTAFVDLYYRVSPPIAQVIADSPTLRFGTRMALTPIVYGVEYPFAGVVMLVVVVAAPLACRARRRARRATAMAA